MITSTQDALNFRDRQIAELETELNQRDEELRELRKDKAILNWLERTRAWIRVWSLADGTHVFSLGDSHSNTIIEAPTLRRAVAAMNDKEGK